MARKAEQPFDIGDSQNAPQMSRTVKHGRNAPRRISVLVQVEA